MQGKMHVQFFGLGADGKLHISILTPDYTFALGEEISDMVYALVASCGARFLPNRC